MFSCKKRFLSGVLILIIVTFFTLGCSKDIATNQPSADQAASTVFKNFNEENFDSDNIMTTINELSSEKYKGRLVGTKENELATEYIAKYFKDIGLENPKGLENYKQYYSQKVLMNNSEARLQIVDKNGEVTNKYSFLDNFRVHTVAPGISIKSDVTSELMAIEDSKQLSVDNTDLNGKVLLIPENMKNDLGYRQLIIVATSNKIDVKGMIWEEDIDNPNHSRGHFTVSPYVHEAYQHGNENDPIIFRCDSSTFKELCEASDNGLSVNMKADYSVEEVQGSNVIGLIPGTDETLKDEFIIIGAHFDHVGDNKNGTYNPGAFDNGSGTAVLMEVAKVLKESGAEPKRSILFVAFNGEEEGLYGSKYFAYHTIYNLNKDNSIMINMDMVGSKQVMPLSIATFERQDIQLKDDFYRFAKELDMKAKKVVMPNSDHTSFAKRGIEAICLIHEDYRNGLHSPVDTIETVDKDRIKEVLRLVIYYLDKKAY